MRNVEVVLGGRKYEIEALPIRKSREWRERFAGPFNRLVSTLQGLPQIELTDVAAFSQMIAAVSGQLLASTDVFLEMLFAYAPDMAEDEDWILDHATDGEAMAAFAEVLRLAYPFGPLLTILRNGQEKTQMQKNSR